MCGGIGGSGGREALDWYGPAWVQVGEAGRFASHLDACFFAWSGPAAMCLYLVLSFRKPALALPNMLIGDGPELCAMS